MTPWARAHLEQARSDFSAARTLLAVAGCSSQATMMLQMAWEKLSKAVLIDGGVDPKQSHAVAERLVGAINRSPRILALFRGKAGAVRLRALKQQVGQLERLVPKLAGDRENLAYPWGKESDRPKWPARNLTRVFVTPRQAGYNLWRDFDFLAENFDRLF